MNKPYEHADRLTGERLSIWANGDGNALLRAFDGDTATVKVGPDEVPAAALALYEATGLPEPLILNRPEHMDGIEHAGIGDRGAYTHRMGVKVAIGWRGIEPQELDPDEALKFAAHIAVNALAAQASEPDQDDIDELAHLIVAGKFIVGNRDEALKDARWDARRILLAGYKREAGQ